MADGKRNKGPNILLLYILSGLVILGLLAWTSFQLLREAPVREASANLPGRGWVNVRFSTDPFPPVTTGTVVLSFMPANDRGVMVDLGPALPFKFGTRGDDSALGSGVATLDATGMFYQVRVQFPLVGDYWLEVDLGSGQNVRFLFYVRPAQ